MYIYSIVPIYLSYILECCFSRLFTYVYIFIYCGRNPNFSLLWSECWALFIQQLLEHTASI